LSKYIVLEDSPSDLFKIKFERFLFNQERHREWSTFSLANTESNEIAAQIHFQVLDGIALSPLNAPFGSIEFSSGLAPELLLFFLNEMETRLRKKGIRKIIIKDTPHQYRYSQSALLTTLLLNSGFRIINQEINSGIVIDDNKWETKISQAEIKRLKRCRKEGLEFCTILNEEVDSVYNFVRSCREERGMSLSMTLSQLKNTFKTCKDDFLLFGVFQSGKMIAATISIKINKRIVYNFYPAHIKSADSLSPAVFLIDGIYSYCLKNKFDLLDLGTSALENKINFSLLNFKTQIGGEPSLKLTFEKLITK
jgi:hypothetical protein